jgi:hypothetical protein
MTVFGQICSEVWNLSSTCNTMCSNGVASSVPGLNPAKCYHLEQTISYSLRNLPVSDRLILLSFEIVVRLRIPMVSCLRYKTLKIP